MTPTQAETLAAMRKHRENWNEWPTRRELGLWLGISAVSAHLRLQTLIRDGLVTVTPKRWRGAAVKG